MPGFDHHYAPITFIFAIVKQATQYRLPSAGSSKSSKAKTPLDLPRYKRKGDLLHHVNYCPTSIKSIPQFLVCVGNFFEHRLALGLVSGGVFVGVPDQGQLSVCLFDVVQWCILGQPKDLVGARRGLGAVTKRKVHIKCSPVTQHHARLTSLSHKHAHADGSLDIRPPVNTRNPPKRCISRGQ